MNAPFVWHLGPPHPGLLSIQTHGLSVGSEAGNGFGQSHTFGLGTLLDGFAFAPEEFDDMGKLTGIPSFVFLAEFVEVMLEEGQVLGPALGNLFGFIEFVGFTLIEFLHIDFI